MQAKGDWPLRGELVRCNAPSTLSKRKKNDCTGDSPEPIFPKHRNKPYKDSMFTTEEAGRNLVVSGRRTLPNGIGEESIFTSAGLSSQRWWVMDEWWKVWGLIFTKESKQTFERIDFYLSGSRLSLLGSGRNDNFEGTETESAIYVGDVKGSTTAGGLKVAVALLSCSNGARLHNI